MSLANPWRELRKVNVKTLFAQNVLSTLQEVFWFPFCWRFTRQPVVALLCPPSVRREWLRNPDRRKMGRRRDGMN